jgi:hypothetical protein
MEVVICCYQSCDVFISVKNCIGIDGVGIDGIGIGIVCFALLGVFVCNTVIGYSRIVFLLSPSLI